MHRAIPLSLAMKMVLGSTPVEAAFSGGWSPSSVVSLMAMKAGSGSDVAMTAVEQATDSDPFLPLLSKGLNKMSIAMRKDTADVVLNSTPSLQRLRRQVQQITEVKPSSLGEQVGLGLFAKKNIKAGTIVGLYPAHALGYELQSLSMFLAATEEDEDYFSKHPHGNSPYLHATDQPLFRRPSLLSFLFDEGKADEPPLFLDVNPENNGELDDIWTSHYINDGASLLDTPKSISIEAGIEQYYAQSTRAKNCIHIPFGPSPILATITNKKVKKGTELFTSYGVVYWLGAVDTTSDAPPPPGMTENIQSQISQSASDLQKAMEDAKRGYAVEMNDLEKVFGDL